MNAGRYFDPRSAVPRSSAEQSQIFDKFHRRQTERYRLQGTGMGLTILKTIVEDYSPLNNGGSE